MQVKPNGKLSQPTAKGGVSRKGKALVDSLQDINPTDPIPFEGGRAFSLIQESEYLPFLSVGDNMAQLLLECRLLSTTNNACVVTKKDYCGGVGFQLTDESDISDKKFTDWCKSMNLRNESDTELRRKMFEHLFTWGNVPIELVRFTVNGQRRFYIYAHNFLEWRLGKPDKFDGISKYALGSKLFNKNNHNWSEEDYKSAKKLPIYNPRNIDRATNEYRDGYNWVKDGRGGERTMIWHRHPFAGFDNYGLPSNVASLIFQKLEYKGGRFELDNMDNNMIVSAILALKGNLTQGEINKIGKRMVSTHTGDGKRGRLMVVGSEQGIEGSDLHSLTTHKEGSYKEADEKWVQKIILANQWDAILAGIVSPSTMGKGTGFLTKIMEHKKTTVIVPAQMNLMDKVWYDILTLAKKWIGFSVDPSKIQIKNNIDISGLTDVDITPAVKVSEVREAKGLTALKENDERGDMMLGELSANQKRGVYVKDPQGTRKDKKDNVQQE